MNTDHYRELLLEERGRVTHSIEHLHAENSLSSADENPSTGLADEASTTLDRELDYSLEENASRLLHEVDAALARIDGGTFGRCERCGQPISEERLEAMPWATKCIDCKRLEERG